MNRRTFLWILAASGLALGITPGGRAKSAGKQLKWRNWSGGQMAQPQYRFAPADEQSLIKILTTTKADMIRPVGAGHSFSPLVPSDGALLSLDLMGGVLSVDQKRRRATFGAGGKLRALSQELIGHELAFRNLPDIDKQSLAGAISTATHGTGADFPSLAAESLSLRLITASGDVVDCSRRKNAELFSAAQVSLGALGIITQITMNLAPAYRLHRRTWFEPYDALAARAENLFRRHRGFEFFYIPFTDHCLAISHDETSAATTPRAPSEDDESVMELKFLRDWFGWSTSLRKKLGRWAISDVPTENIVGESHDLLSTAREVRFNEMEYHLPMQNGLAALDEVKTLIERDHPDVFFPIECRIIKQDDAWLSPFYRGDRISIAVHAYYRDDHRALFAAVEPVFRRHGGRPHWGKINSLTRRDFAALYPQWEKFRRLRTELDPHGKLLNPYLRRLFL